MEKSDDNKKAVKKINFGIRTDIDFKFVPKAKAVFSIILIVTVLVFSVHQVFVLFGNEKGEEMQTQTANLQTIYRNINTRGFVLRKEHVISGSASGMVVPQVENGSKVAFGDTVARVYKNEQAARNAMEAKTLEREIEYYESIASTLSGSLLADINLYESNVLNSLIETKDCIDSGALKDLTPLLQDLRLDITKKLIAVGGKIDVSEKINELYAQYNSLTASASGYTSITTSYAGFFVNETDSLESLADYENAASLLYDDVEELLSRDVVYKSEALGKVITEFTWYLVCNVEDSQLDGIKVGNKYKIGFSELSGKDIKMKVIAINQNDNGYATVIFESNEMSNDIASLRISDIKIRAEEYTGYGISINAVRTLKEEKDGVETNTVGVYVKLGSVIRFRKIDIVYSDDNIILAYSKPGESGYIERYDEVITEGTDLYDGKIVA